MIVGTAGHIDHGKTTLVRALTGVDCDRLKEEKARGITLDIGYAYLPTGDDAGGIIGFIDVPGHEKLIHNMLAGATGIDVALLVVAADDGPMPQTREHLEIVELLGIRHGIVALTKVDAVDAGRRAAAAAEVAAMLAPTALAGAPVVPVSAATGAGLDVLRDLLTGLAGRLDRRAAGDSGAGHFRLAIDRSFTLAGVGTVVTGTAFAGRVRAGDALVLSPSGRSVRVRSLRVQDRAADSGAAGDRIALGLAGVEKAEVRRGQWLVAAPLDRPVRRFDARLRVLPGQPALTHLMPVHLHLGAEDVTGRVALLEGNELGPGGEAFAELLLDREIGALAGDRIVLRDASARRTLAGGLVLDVFAPTRKKRSPERRAMLHALADPDPRIALALAAESHPAGVELATVAISRNLDPARLATVCTALGLRVIGGCGFAPARWAELAQRLRAAVTAEHERAPDMPGVERERLRRMTSAKLARPAFDTLVGEALAAGELAQTGAWLHRPDHRVQLAAGDRELWAVLAPLFAPSPANPPRVRDLARASGIAEDRVRQLMKRLARTGELYPVAHDHYFTAAAVADLARRVAGLCERDGAARAATLRDEIGGGRKVAIHILEFFDRIGYTRRVRDSHSLRGSPAQFG